jgi:mRNA interferase MazF
VYSAQHGLSSQVVVGIHDGLKHDSAIHCDELVSLPKTALTDYVGTLSEQKIADLNQALAVALELAGV